jgi:hypothetical protein
MILVFQIIQVFCLNGVLLTGVLWAGWSDGTAISLFWCENAIMIPLISLRIILHRRATNKRGHYVTSKVSYDNGVSWQTRTITANSAFLQIMGFTTFVIGVFVAAAVFMINEGSVDMDALGRGVSAAALFMVAGFGLDLIGIGKRPFAWVKKLYEGAIGRNILLIGAFLIGLPLTVCLGKPKIIFGIFGGLKLLHDVARLFPQYDRPEAPNWLVRIFGRDFADFWRRDSLQQTQREKFQAAACEEPYDGRPMGDL